MLPKLSELNLLTNKTKAAVVTVTETWLDQTCTPAEVNIENLYNY